MKTSKDKERELIIRLHNQERSTREIGNILGISKSKAAFWIKRHKESGSLKDKPRSGKPSQLTKEQFKIIRDALHDFPPSRYGGESIGWTTKMLIKFIKEEFGIKFGVRYAEKIMHKSGIRLVTPRPIHVKSSRGVQDVYKNGFKKNSRKNIWIAPSLISMNQHSD